MSAMMGITSVLPAQAMPQPLPQPSVQSGQQVETVAFRGDNKRIIRNNRNYRYHTWRGHRGYSYQRYGYRRHSDGFWYPFAAFTAGAVIGGALSGPTYRARHVGSGHKRWCKDHYASYRASDNTFQPYNGPRRACVSP